MVAIFRFNKTKSNRNTGVEMTNIQLPQIDCREYLPAAGRGGRALREIGSSDYKWGVKRHFLQEER